MNNACVIGYGTVGKATAKAFGIDHYYSRTEKNIELEQAGNFKYIFICLPTPSLADGSVYTVDIIKVIEEIIVNPKSENSIFIIRSTVPPGFNRELQRGFGIDRFVSNPEFLNEDTAFEDAKNPDLIVIGADNPEYAKQVEAIYVSRFRYRNLILTNSVTAELIKYGLNTFFATKVMFANELYDYAQKINANYEIVKEALQTHKWGSQNHFTIHYKGKRGLHGKCLPKDTKAFAKLTRSPFFTMLVALNKQHE